MEDRTFFDKGKDEGGRRAACRGDERAYLFADRYLGYDDAIYATCRLAEILAESNKKTSELLSDVPKTYSTPEIRIDCPDEKKFQIVEAAKERFRKEYKIIDVDGVRILFNDGWGLIRASNTQPVLVMRFEANSEKRLKEIKDFVEAELNKCQTLLQ